MKKKNKLIRILIIGLNISIIIKFNPKIDKINYF